MTADGCLFCRIAAKKIPAKILHEDADVVAFADIAPQAPVHVLVIPRRHVASLKDVGEGEAALMMKLIGVFNKLAKELGVAESGYRLVSNIGDDAQQSVPHLHLHLLGGRPFRWPPG
ncbi:MAG: histidine triad nucleotide-binding protein [Candidatus Coatesbacteria bacterium]